MWAQGRRKYQYEGKSGRGDGETMGGRGKEQLRKEKTTGWKGKKRTSMNVCGMLNN